MNKILDILDSMEMTRLIAEKNPEEFTVDAVIREFSDMLAGAFGYKNREEWIKCLEKLPESRYFHRDDAEKDCPVCYSGPENQDPDKNNLQITLGLQSEMKACFKNQHTLEITIPETCRRDHWQAQISYWIEGKHLLESGNLRIVKNRMKIMKYKD